MLRWVYSFVIRKEKYKLIQTGFRLYKICRWHLIIDEEEAKVVKRIYRDYLSGSSLREIAAGLKRDKIKNGEGHLKWHLSNIRGILENEKYIGDALLQKTTTIDFVNKVRIKNDRTEPRYYVKDNHKAIIPKDIFIQVQEEML